VDIPPDPAERPPQAQAAYRYRILVHGQVDPSWAAMFGDVQLAWDGGNTVLTSRLVDQAALYGLLARLRDLGLPLMSLSQLTNHDFP